MLRGSIDRVVPDRGFGFIRCGRDNYFFHKSALVNANWDDIVDQSSDGKADIRVSFTGEDTPKGLRAENVSVEE